MKENFNKKDYKFIRRWMNKDRGVFTASKALLDDNHNGLTIAFKKAIENTNCKMICVAVSYCSIEDKFDKRTGKYHALSKLDMGEYVQLPLAADWDQFGKRYIKRLLLSKFE